MADERYGRYPVPQPSREKHPVFPDVLADRYASIPMLDIWIPEAVILNRRDFYIAVMKGQSDLGHPIPQGAIEAYQAARDYIDFPSIAARELITHHDVKAQLDEFNERAGHEYAGLGMTSKDLTDNVDQIQNRRAMGVVRDKAVATLARIARSALEYDDLIAAERTHNVPAQPFLFGKLFSNFGEELLEGLKRLDELMERYPLRGMKGAIGTQTDQIQLLGGKDKAMALDRKIAEYLGFKSVMGSVGQIYRRSLDFDMISALFQIVAGPSNIALNTRLRAGNDQMTEGFSAGQTGSAGMPHKMNAIKSERVFALRNTLIGYVNMAMQLSGNQWNAGDVSDSVTRRVMIPDAFFATDGLFETTLHVLDECQVYPAVVQQELNRQMPFLTSTRLLMAAVKKGMGRETAHRIIKEASTASLRRWREEGVQEDFVEKLVTEGNLGLTRQDIETAMAKPIDYVGTSSEQIGEFAEKVQAIVDKHPEAAAYQPEPIL